MQHEPTDVAVIGAGGAGTMAFLRSVLNGQDAVLFLGDADSKRKGRATWVMEVENIPGMHDVKRPIVSTGKSTLDWLGEHPDFGDETRTLKGKVDKLEKTENGFRLHWKVKGEEHSIEAKFVVVATGIMDVQPHIQGSIEPIFPYANRGHAIYCVRCDGHQTKGKQLALIGNSNAQAYIGAIMIERYGHEHVSLLTNGADHEFSQGAQELIDGYGMLVHTAPIAKVLGEPKGDGLHGFELEGGEVVDAERVIIALGVIPYNELLKDVGAELDKVGKALVSDKYETNVPGVFVVGDLVAGKKMQIYTGWDGAVDAVDEIDLRLRTARRAERFANA